MCSKKKKWLHGTGGAQQMDLVRDNMWVRPCRLCDLIHNMLKKVVICTIKFFVLVGIWIW